MKVELSIKDDRELRAHIKDVIKGQIVSIARGEVINILADTIGAKTDAANIHKIVKETVESEVKRALGERGGWQGKSFVDTIRAMATRSVQEKVGLALSRT